MNKYQKVRAAIYSLLPLLVVYGAISEEQAALWGAAVWAVVNAVLAVFNINTGEPSDPGAGF